MSILDQLTLRKVLVAVATSGALAVIFGAFGAHALRSDLDAQHFRVFQTAVQYHFYHTFALAIVALAMRVYGEGRWLSASAWLFILGLVLFSGSLYVLAISGLSWLGAITPLGGLSFICAWLCLGAAAIRDKKTK